MRVEVRWFSVLCDDDSGLGVPDPRLGASWERCRKITQPACCLHCDEPLLPSGAHDG